MEWLFYGDPEGIQFQLRLCGISPAAVYNCRVLGQAQQGPRLQKGSESGLPYTSHRRSICIESFLYIVCWCVMGLLLTELKLCVVMWV